LHRLPQGGKCQGEGGSGERFRLPQEGKHLKSWLTAANRVEPLYTPGDWQLFVAVALFEHRELL